MSDADGKQILLFHIPQGKGVYATQADDAFVRVGDKSKKLGFRQWLMLVYAKGEMYYEDAPINNSSLNDINIDLVHDYTNVLRYGKSPIQYLREHGFFAVSNGWEVLTGAAILLFGKKPDIFFPMAQIRLIRYDGNEALTGS